MHQHRGALRGTPESASSQPEPNATELPSSAPGRPKLIETQSYRPPSLRPRRHAPRKTSPRRRAMDPQAIQATEPSPTPTRTKEHIATTPDCGPAGPPHLRPRRHAEHLDGLKIVRLRALARRRAPSPTGARRRELRTSPSYRPHRAEEENFARLPHQQRVSNVQRGYEESVHVGLIFRPQTVSSKGHARDQTCASWCSRLPDLR